MADLDARSVGNMQQNPQNAEQTKVIRNSNKFPLDYAFPTTHRYGEVDVFYHYRGERGDVVPLRSGHSINTYTMKSRNDIDIFMRKEYLHVPMKAIYPRTWDVALYPLPVDGDLPPTDLRANFDVGRYLHFVFSHLGDIYSSIFEEGSTVNEILSRIGSFCCLIDGVSDIVSNGSLFSSFNIHLSNVVSVNTSTDLLKPNYLSWDRFVSLFYTNLSTILYNNLYNFSDPNNSENSIQVWFGSRTTKFAPDVTVLDTWHKFHEFLRYGQYSLNSPSLSAVGTIDVSSLGTYSFKVDGFFPESQYINIEPIIAYQLCCAQFYTNDRVDDIYSAEVYRDYMQSFVSFNRFEYNGVEYLYDVFSQRNLDEVIDTLLYSPELGNDSVLSFLVLTSLFFSEIFHRRESLRYGDYFNGARVKPLAVGESRINVTDGSVMVEDITKSAALQRLRYNVNVIGRKVKNQLMGLIPGKAPKTPDDIPTLIASQDFNIGKDSRQVSNTSLQQISLSDSTTQFLSGGASDYAFTVELTEPCILLGLVSFSIPRIYSKTVDRFAFHMDRFDMFIPQMQFIGDQEIYRKELFGVTVPDGDLPFAYNQRYSEYKQRYSYASGGFVEFLPSWDMITDNDDGLMLFAGRTLSSEIAHSVSSEFDRFFVSLTGNSLADYFHFIVKHYNTSTPERAMAWNPQPLL